MKAAAHYCAGLTLLVIVASFLDEFLLGRRDHDAALILIALLNGALFLDTKPTA